MVIESRRFNFSTLSEIACKIIVRNFMFLCYNTYKKLISKEVYLFVLGATAPSGPGPPHSQGF